MVKDTRSVLMLIGTFVLLFGVIFEGKAQSTMGTYSELETAIIDSSKKCDIIALGELPHQDKTHHYLKAQVIKDIASNMPVGALLFEAPLTTSVIAYIEKDSYASFVWPFWRYEGLKDSIENVIDDNGLLCLGFDPQETCNFPGFRSFLMSNRYLIDDTEMVLMDSILDISIASPAILERRSLTAEEAKTVARLIEEIKLKISWPEACTPIQKKLILLCMENRKYLAEEMTMKINTDNIYNYRDSIMALNIKSLNEIFASKLADKKIIIWAADPHIAKRDDSNTRTWMIERFVKNNDESVLSIGLIPRKRKKKARYYDFTLISGKPKYLTKKQFNDFNCK